MNAAQQVLKDMNTPWKSQYFFWRHIPSLRFWRVKIKSFDAHQAAVTIPFNRRNKNPFRSTYFAALAGAAEISSGLLAVYATKLFTQRISMLVVNFESSFTKKATGITTFTCNDGAAFTETVQRAIDTNEGQTLQSQVIGRNEQNEIVMTATITWSFKAK